MKPKREEFEKIFEQQRGIPFRLEEEFASYCLGDTQILMAAFASSSSSDRPSQQMRMESKRKGLHLRIPMVASITFAIQSQLPPAV
jgi:hypothetical protein